VIINHDFHTYGGDEDMAHVNCQMLAWTHSLPSPPAYIDVASAVARSSDDVDNLLIVASQDSPPEIHCFQFHSDTRRHAAPQACGPPWRVSVPQYADFMFSLLQFVFSTG